MARLGSIAAAFIGLAGGLAAQAGLLAIPAAAQPLPSSRADIPFTYAPLVKKVSPAVVNIYTTTTARVQRRLPFPIPGMPQDGSRMQNSLGSGVLVKADGLIVTNAHVVKGADEIRVVLHDRREFDAKLVTQDDRYDLALLRIDDSSEKFPTVELRDSDSVEVGDVVLAIGNPFGLNQTVTQGIISAVARSAGGVNDSSFFLQTDAAINPGNSGGALVSLDGRLIGINTAIYSQTGGSVGIGFATPSNIVARLISTSETGGRIVRPWLGISMQLVNDTLNDAFGQRQISTIYGQANQYRVILEASAPYQSDPSALAKIFLTGAGGAQVQLDSLAQIRLTTGPLMVARLDQFPAAPISFDLAPDISLGDAVKDIRQAETDIGLPQTIIGAFSADAAEFSRALQARRVERQRDAPKPRAPKRDAEPLYFADRPPSFLWRVVHGWEWKGLSQALFGRADSSHHLYKDACGQ